MVDKGRMDRLLAADALDMAEKITGNSYQEDEGTGFLGMALHMKLGEEKRKLLKEANDTCYGMKIGEFSAILIMNEFEKVLTIPFMGTGYGDEPVQEYLYFFWNKEKSILVRFDTFGGSVNSSTAYFNWYEYEGQSHYMPINGGGKDKRFLGTSIDTREGFIRYIERMEMAGEFLKEWIENPFLWLLHYMDTKEEGYDYKAINAERIIQLPGDVLDAMGHNKL